jgi:hypothetical protein
MILQPAFIVSTAKVPSLDCKSFVVTEGREKNIHKVSISRMIIIPRGHNTGLRFHELPVEIMSEENERNIVFSAHKCSRL